jgi:very-short-patch-repair endonuclease
MIFNGTDSKYTFRCDKDHLFDCSINNVSYGRWCPSCKNKTEIKLFEFIKNIQICEKQKSFDWCKNKRFLLFDFYIKDLSLIIELDGIQHFKQISNWKCYKKNVETDVYKMKMALNKGISVIRILQEDVWNDKNDWRNRLKNSIKIYNEPTIIYLDNNNEYIKHKSIYFL